MNVNQCDKWPLEVNIDGQWSENGQNRVFLRETLFFLYILHILHKNNAGFWVLKNFLRMSWRDWACSFVEKWRSTVLPSNTYFSNMIFIIIKIWKFEKFIFEIENMNF